MQLGDKRVSPTVVLMKGVTRANTETAWNKAGTDVLHAFRTRSTPPNYSSKEFYSTGSDVVPDTAEEGMTTRTDGNVEVCDEVQTFVLRIVCELRCLYIT